MRREGERGGKDEKGKEGTAGKGRKETEREQTKVDRKDAYGRNG